jgi:hypothetical protein
MCHFGEAFHQPGNMTDAALLVIIEEPKYP